MRSKQDRQDRNRVRRKTVQYRFHFTRIKTAYHAASHRQYKMCLICTCENGKCPEKVVSDNLVLGLPINSTELNNNIQELPIASTELIMSKHIPSPTSPELAQDCLDPVSFYTPAIDVPEACDHDVNDIPLAAHPPQKVDKLKGLLVGPMDDKVKILELINRGSFGRVYRGIKVNTGEQVAIKAEDQGSGHEKILNEANLCQKLEGCAGIPTVYWYGMHGSDYNFMVMEYLGPSLLDLFESCNNRFSLQTVLKIVAGILPTMQYLHDQNVMHRDISPRNIVIGVGEKRNQLYLIDFGFAKRCTRKGQMILPSPTRYGAYCNPPVGTPRFTSINCHRGGMVGRSDDLESLGYILVYFLKSSLPWQDDVSDNPIERARYIEHTKVITPVETLCEGIPDEFATLISYARLLRYYETPDYASIEILFKNLIKNANINLDIAFDWERKGDDIHKDMPAPRLKKVRSSLARLSGSDESTVVPFSCALCKSNAHFSCNSN